MKHERFFARFRFDGWGLNELTISSKEVFDTIFKIEHNEVFNSRFLSVGDIFTYENRRHKVTHISVEIRYEKTKVEHLDPRPDAQDYDTEIIVTCECLDKP